MQQNRNAIIFGATGQDGYYLNQLLKKKGFEGVCVSRIKGPVTGDVTDFSFVSNVIKKYQPYFVFHFAANSTTRHDALFENHEAISTGTLNILESVRRHCPNAKVFLPGSALQFKNDGKPINEQTPFEAESPYAVARIQSVYAARYYRNLNVKSYIGYFFHHDSPLRAERHLSMAIVKSTISILNGVSEYIEVRNPDFVKEFNHAADIINAVWLMVNQDQIYEAVIGSGVGHSIEEWILTCLNYLGIDVTGRIKFRPEYKPKHTSIISSPEKIKSIGWKPVYNMNKLAQEMIKSELSKLK